ncbi:HERC2, partial [Symbiodinium sp. CCMP2456]
DLPGTLLDGGDEPDPGFQDDSPCTAATPWQGGPGGCCRAQGARSSEQAALPCALHRPNAGSDREFTGSAELKVCHALYGRLP